MQLILRKPDSATNLLLFIYKFNSYFNPQNNSALKLSSVLEIMKLFGKNESAVRVALSRATKSGLFVNKKKGSEVYYSPSATGEKIVARLVNETNCLFKRYKLRNSLWDKNWLCVLVTESSSSIREKKPEIIEGLQNLGFAQLANNMWISPYNLSDEVKHLAEEFGIEDSIVSIYGQMIANSDMDEFKENVFKLKRFKDPYSEFNSIFGKKLEEIKELIRENTIIPKELSVPLLYKLGSSFFDVALRDSFLPMEILPEWEGDKTASIMVELFELITPSVRSHFCSHNDL